MKMRIFIFLVLVFLGVMASFSLQAAEPLRVVLDRDYPPFTYFDEEGKLEGVSVEFWRLWEKKTGVPVELVPVELREALNMMRLHKADAIDTIFLPLSGQSTWSISSLSSPSPQACTTKGFVGTSVP